MQLLDHLQPQLSEVITNLLNQGYTAIELSETVVRPHWIDKNEFLRSPFATETFRMGKEDVTLYTICDIMDKSVNVGIPFSDLLRRRVLLLLNPEYEREVAAAESQRELVWSYERVIERESGVA